MIYYDTHISQMAQSRNWKILINPNINIKKINNWFLQHKKDWGNYEFTKKRFLIVAIIATIIEAICFVI